MGTRRSGQARRRRSARRRADPGLPRRTGAQPRPVDRRRHDAAAGRRRRRAWPLPASSTTPRAAQWRATTRSTCSTSTCPARPKATANRAACGPARSRSRSIRRPAGSAWPSVTTCASPSCSANCWRRAPSGSRCRRPSPCRPGRAHWELLLRARAVENLCYMVAPAQSGFHENGRETHGDSMIVEPWGRVLARLPRGTGVITAELDLARQRRLRQDFPAVRHRRLALDRAPPGSMKPNIPPPLFAPQPAALVAGVAARDPLDVARAALLGPAELDENRVASVLGDVMGHAVDYGDIYFQLTREESWALEDGIVKDGAHSIEQGVGVRALAGEKTGFAYSDEVMLPALLEAAHAARAISRAGSGGTRAGLACHGRAQPLPADRPGRVAWRTTTRSGCSSRSTARRARSIRASRRSWRASPPRTTSCSSWRATARWRATCVRWCGSTSA